ncbi:MAG: glycosyltransferase family 2 protein [Eubacterium sp.]|nr:glycosyltransferase family 2 protein [Eubacterium sp.]
MQKILTVTIPAYNVEKYIEKCLDSMILGQAYMDMLEILVIDDGGTDNTAEIVRRKYVKRYPDSIHFFHKENAGHGSVINFGIAHACGKYFKIVDGDDWLNTNEIQNFLELLSKVNYDIIASDYQCIEDGTYKLLRQMDATGDPKKYGKSGKISDGFADRVIKMHSMTIRTDILKKMPMSIDENCFYVDAEYITYPIPWAETLYYDQRNLYRYRLGRSGQSMEIKSMQQRHNQHLNVLHSLEKFYDNLPELPAQKKYYIERCIAQVVENEFQIAISMGTKPGVQVWLRANDIKLKNNYPNIWKATKKKSIVLLRKTNYRILPFSEIIFRIVKSH